MAVFRPGSDEDRGLGDDVLHQDPRFYLVLLVSSGQEMGKPVEEIFSSFSEAQIDRETCPMEFLTPWNRETTSTSSIAVHIP